LTGSPGFDTVCRPGLGGVVLNMLSNKSLRKVTLVGVGLLGGSIGLAIRAAGSAVRRVGVGRRMSSLDKALAYDAVDEVTLDMADGVADADLVIVCTPIGVMASMFERMAPHLPPGCIVTDVGSTKAEVVRIARRSLPKRARFVGSHPIAGSEKTSVEFARADLFQNAVCVVTPTKHTDPTAIRDVAAFWRAIGGRPVVTSPARHDRALARVSHLPHAVAAALVLQAGAEDLRFAGTGFADTSRIASGDPGLWRDIFGTNRQATLRALAAFQRELTRFRAALEAGDGAAVSRWLERAKTRREAWVQQRYAQQEMDA
jgi:prephenate dehydrogenase